MTNTPRLTAIVLSLAMAMTANAQQGPPRQTLDAETVRGETTIEFRIAKDKSAEGLVEATVGDSEEKIDLHKSAVLTRDDIAHAHAVSNENDVTIACQFTEAGAKKMAQLSSDNIGKRLAIIVDGKVISAPVIRGKSSSNAAITGNFAEQEAQRIAHNIIRGRVKVIAQKTKSAAEADELASLQGQRIETLRQAVELIAAHYRQGETSVAQLVDAQRELLEARLDAASTGEQRVEILTQLLDVHASSEKAAAVMFRVGNATRVDLLLAKTARLRVEILLLEEKQSSVENTQNGNKNEKASGTEKEKSSRKIKGYRIR